MNSKKVLSYTLALLSFPIIALGQANHAKNEPKTSSLDKQTLDLSKIQFSKQLPDLKNKKTEIKSLSTDQTPLLNDNILKLAGGMNSGGGSTISSNPANQSMVVLAAKNSRQILTAWFRNKQLNYEKVKFQNTNQPSVYSKLFNSKTAIYEFINNTSIEVRGAGPCLTSEGADRDGSIHSSYQNAICISAFSIVQKTDSVSVEGQVIALVAHELSHLLDANEEEAIVLQTDVLSDINGINTTDHLQKVLTLQGEVAELLSDNVLNGVFPLDWTSAGLIEANYRNLWSKFFSTKLETQILVWLPNELFEQSKAQLAHLDAAAFWACNNAEGAPVQQVKDICKQAEQITFYGSDTVTAKQYFSRLSADRMRIEFPSVFYSMAYDDVIVTRPHSMIEASNELAAFRKFVASLKDALLEQTQESKLIID